MDDCFDVARYMDSDVPSTRCALLEGSSRREGHSCAEDVEGVEPASSSPPRFFFCSLRPGIGKENFPLRPMMSERHRRGFEELVACWLLGSATQV